LTTQSQRKRRLGEILMDAGLITEVQLNAALSEQRKWGGKLGRTLVEMGFVDESSMTTALSRQLHIPEVNLDTLALPPDALEFLRVDIAERYGVFPVAGDRRAKSVTIATSDPTNADQFQELSFNTGMRIQVVVASASSIDRAIRRHYYGESTVSSDVTTPRELGVNEAEYDPAELAAQARGQQAAQAGQPTAAARGPIAADLAAQLAEANRRMAELERLVAGQGRALRGMLELLLEKGVLDRETYLVKVRGGKDS
jgi:type IV pilus assembly protein PilB